MGRRKIEIKLVKDSNTRQVTFSKRRTGLFKKANELSILTGAKMAIVVFSPGNKPYSFGHPNVEAVAAKFLGKETRSNKGKGKSSSKIVNLDKLNQEFAEVTDQLCKEQKQGLAHDEALGQFKVSELHELQQLRDSLKQLNCTVKSRLDDMEAAQILMELVEKPVEIKQLVGKRKRKNE